MLEGLQSESMAKVLYWFEITVALLNNPFFNHFFLYIGAEVIFGHNELHSGVYHLVGADLRRIKDIEAKFSECNLDYSKPTAFIFECVLVYLPVASSHALLKFIADKFHTAFCVNYEQVCCYITSK